MATITKVQSFAGAQSVCFINFGSLAGAFPANVAHAWMVYFRETSGDSGAFQYLVAKCDATGAGQRIFTDSTGGAARYGMESTGNTLAPSRGSTAVYTQAQWHCIMGVYDGAGVASTDIKLYHSINGGAFVEATYGSGTEGSGTIVTDAADTFMIGNRPSGTPDRAFKGRLGYVAHFDLSATPITSAAQVQAIFDNGPLSDSRCDFLWANGQDYVGGKTPTSTGSGVTDDTVNLPPNTVLGELASPMSASARSSGIAAAALTTSVQLISNAITAVVTIAALTTGDAGMAAVAASSGSAQVTLTAGIALQVSASSSSIATAALPSVATTLEANFAGANANTTLSSISNANSDTPTATIRVRSPEDSEWQQAQYKLVGVRNKVVTNEWLLAEKEDDDSFLGTWQGPWYSFDGVNWINQPDWEQVPGDRMTFAVDCGANDEVWIASLPPWTQDTVIPWVEALAAAHPTRIKSDLPSHTAHGGAPYVCALSGTGTDENGRAISNLPLISFVIRDDSLGDPAQKRYIELWCGVHSGEWNGGLQLRGAVSEILTGVHSTALLSRFVFVVRPIMSPKGSYLGFRRNEASASFINNLDANREWADGDTSLATVVQWQGILDADHGVNHASRVVGFFDFHDGKTISDKAWFYYFTGQAGFSEFEAIAQAENAEINAAFSSISGGSTSQYWMSKGVNFAWTCEVGDEISTTTELQAIGAAYMRALKLADDDGQLPQFHNLVSASGSSSLATAALATSIPLQASAISSAAAGAVLLAGADITAVAVSQSASQATLTAGMQLQAAAVGASIASAGLVTGVLLQSEAISSVAAYAVLQGGAAPFECAAGSRSVANAALVTAISLTASGYNTATAVASLLEIGGMTPPPAHRRLVLSSESRRLYL